MWSTLPVKHCWGQRNSEQTLDCTNLLIVQVVHHRPEILKGQLDFGTMGVEEPRSMTFTLRNDNPVDVSINPNLTAHFTVYNWTTDYRDVFYRHAQWILVLVDTLTWRYHDAIFKHYVISGRRHNNIFRRIEYFSVSILNSRLSTKCLVDNRE